MAEERLIRLFERLPNGMSGDSLKWAIGNTLEGLNLQPVSDQLIAMVQDPRHGIGRQMIVSAMGRLKHPQATETLIRLLADDQVALHAIGALRLRRAWEALPPLAGLEDHPSATIRRAARAAAKAIEKHGGRGTLH